MEDGKPDFGVPLRELVNYLDDLLGSAEIADYCPNGLQVEAGTDVVTLVSGVTASQALVDRAVEARADALLVHHGYFWKGENPCLTGVKGRRIATLLNSGVSLVSYHLPMDLHPEHGNNAQLARRLGFYVDGRTEAGGQKALLFHGRTDREWSGSDLSEHISKALGREPVWVAGSGRMISTVAWCTGAAQGFLEAAADLGVDAYLSGEISEPTTHLARERGIHYFACGHHATERYGPMALGEHLARRFGLAHRFIDVPNPA